MKRRRQRKYLWVGDFSHLDKIFVYMDERFFHRCISIVKHEEPFNKRREGRLRRCERRFKQSQQREVFQ